MQNYSTAPTTIGGQRTATNPTEQLSNQAGAAGGKFNKNYSCNVSS